MNANERISVNRVVESKSTETIRTQDERNSQRQRKYCSNTNRSSKMSQSSAITLLNEKFLPANYVTYKTIQRVAFLLKKKQHNICKQIVPSLAAKVSILLIGKP